MRRPVRTARQVSAGGVIVRTRRGRAEVCLIARRKDDAVVWGLPKGHVEPGEATAAAALREVREETGLTGDVIARLGSLSYWFTEEGVRYFKRVHVYLMRYRTGATADHEDEVDEARWLPFDDALARMTYPSERLMLRKARRRLGKIR